MSAPAAAPLPALQPERRPRRPPAPRAPRRVSGPSRRPARRGAPDGLRGRSLALDAIALLERLSRHRLLDRLIRGRAWIALVAFALIGIVTLQLALLKLNAGVGRALEHAAMLQRENTALSIANSELGSSAHVQAKATRLGMEFASSASLRFLSAHPRSDAGHAAGALSAPRSSSEEGRAAASSSSSGAGGGSGAPPASGEEGGSVSAGAASGAGAASAPAQGSERVASEAPAGEAASGGRASEASSAGAGAGTASGSTGASTGAPAQGSAEASAAGGTGANPQG